jgi:hypothetical protein
MKSFAAAALLLGVTAATAQTLDDLKSDGRNTDGQLIVMRDFDTCRNGASPIASRARWK